jgi:outer membrane protein OmpA-like peptidoglycan-associated protein
LPPRGPTAEPKSGDASVPPTPARAPTPEVLVVVLPEADGKVGIVLVENENGIRVLNTAYAAARVASEGTVAISHMDGAAVREQFSAVLSAQPERPASYMVWFVEGQDEPTVESGKELKKILDLIRQRRAPDVSVIGHADAIGSDTRNDKLSLQRARRIRSALIRLGIPADHINAAGRGAREPLYPSEKPGAPEPRNRRVEISVR